VSAKILYICIVSKPNMSKELDNLNNLFNITFSVFTFWLVTVGYFLASVSQNNIDKILLNWSPIILLYIIAYLFFINQKDNKKFIDWKIQLSKLLLQINLVLLGLTILILSNIRFCDIFNNFLEPIITMLFFIMLIFIAFIIPILLIILLYKFSK
jgi:hypothetical protein